MKTLTVLLASLLISATAFAQDNSTQPAQDQAAQSGNAPVVAATADTSAAALPAGTKSCRTKGFMCHLKDQSLEPGDHCMCGNHPGFVYINE